MAAKMFSKSGRQTKKIIYLEMWQKNFTADEWLSMLHHASKFRIEKTRKKYQPRLHKKWVTLREKCPNTKFFLVRMRENMDQKKLCIWTLFTQSYIPNS